MAAIGISEMLCEVIRSESEYKQLYNTLYKFISGGSRFSQGPSLITGLSDGARNVLCASLAAESAFLTGEDGKKTPLILVPDEKTAYSMRSKLSAFLENVYVFPARDFNFYNVGALSKEWEYERLKVLRALVSGECDAVLAVPEAALALLPPAEYLRKGKALKIGDTVPVAALVKTLDEYGYVYAHLPASPGCEDARPLGLIAHMDTAPAASGENVQPRVVRYEGGELALGASVLSPQDYPSLERYVGQELIVTDGTTLLGADDKAGVAEIVSACAELLAHPEIPHRAIAVCFTPDEEIGRGADHFDRAKFPAPVAYTVDGGELGEIEYENFNAAAAELTVRGLNIHPGEAKNKMKNAVLMANQFLSLLPPAQTPAHTEGYEGFYHVCAMEGDESLARVQLIVRDHDRKKFETRKDFLRRTADYLNTVWGAGSFELTVRDSYYNMKEKILPHMDLIENAQAAMRAADVAPRIVAIRGGTDGAQLSWEGLPCPNLSTGGLNFHSIHEYIPVESLQKMTRVLVALARA